MKNGTEKEQQRARAHAATVNDSGISIQQHHMAMEKKGGLRKLDVFEADLRIVGLRAKARDS